VPVTSYSISFDNSTPGVMSSSVNVCPCVGDVCECLPNVSTYCQTTGNISITVSAKNELGVGLSSDPMYVGKSLLHDIVLSGRKGQPMSLHLHFRRGQTTESTKLLWFPMSSSICVPSAQRFQLTI
jgi:hypothetical protein